MEQAIDYSIVRNLRENDSLRRRIHISETKIKLKNNPEFAFNENIAALTKLASNGEYAGAYDLADKLLKKYDVPDNEDAAFKRAVVEKKIKCLLKVQYKDAIIKKYNSLFEEVYRFDSKIEFISSKYPGTFEEYARVKAIDKLMSQLGKSRYGGHMHMIVSSVLEDYFREQKAQALKEGKLAATSKAIPREPMVKNKYIRRYFKEERER